MTQWSIHELQFTTGVPTLNPYLTDPPAYNDRVGMAILCPITNQSKGYPFEVPIPKGLDVTGVILSDPVKNLDWRVRKAELICTLPDATITDVLQKLHTLL